MIKWLRRISQNAETNLDQLVVELKSLVADCPHLFRSKKHHR